MNNIEKSEKTKNIIKDYKNSSNKDLSFVNARETFINDEIETLLRNHNVRDVDS